MTYEQIEKSFFEHFERYGVSMDEDEDTFKFESPEPSVILSFLKQSFIKYLKDEVERLNLIKDYYMSSKMDVGIHNVAFLIDQITHITNQIKELEK